MIIGNWKRIRLGCKTYSTNIILLLRKKRNVVCDNKLEINYKKGRRGRGYEE